MQLQIIFSTELANVIRTDRGVRLHDLEGHIYQIVETHPTGRVYWRCQFARRSELKCKAKVHTQPDTSGRDWIISKSGFHNHFVNHQ
jgi:hypothetical protein